MRLTIIRDDSAVGVDGVFRRIDLSSLRANVRAVQWNGTSGHIEYDDTANTLFTNIAEFQSFVDLWKAAASEQITSLTAPSADQMRAAALARINTAYQSKVRELTAGYPEEEVKSWALQEAEAKAWFSNPQAHTPWLDSAADARNMSKAELAAKITTKAAAFAGVHGQLTGKRQRLQDMIVALGDFPTPQQLDDIKW
jgi:hypothetical protein